MDQSADHMKMNLECFQIHKGILQTFTSEKADKKMGHLSTFHVPCMS